MTALYIVGTQYTYLNLEIVFSRMFCNVQHKTYLQHLLEREWRQRVILRLSMVRKKDWFFLSSKLTPNRRKEQNIQRSLKGTL